MRILGHSLLRCQDFDLDRILGAVLLPQRAHLCDNALRIEGMRRCTLCPQYLLPLFPALSLGERWCRGSLCPFTSLRPVRLLTLRLLCTAANRPLGGGCCSRLAGVWLHFMCEIIASGNIASCMSLADNDNVIVIGDAGLRVRGSL